MTSQHERESYLSWCKVLAFAALLAGLASILCGCARGYGNGPSTDGITEEVHGRPLFQELIDSAELERIRRERQAGGYRDIRGLMGGAPTE